MEPWLRVKDVAELMGCSYDTARARMEEMPGVINVGSRKRRQLMVPVSGMEDWLRNHRMADVMPQIMKIPRSKEGRMARINRRTGKLAV